MGQAKFFRLRTVLIKTLFIYLFLVMGRENPLENEINEVWTFITLMRSHYESHREKGFEYSGREKGQRNELEDDQIKIRRYLLSGKQNTKQSSENTTFLSSITQSIDKNN